MAVCRDKPVQLPKKLVDRMHKMLFRQLVDGAHIHIDFGHHAQRAHGGAAAGIDVGILGRRTVDQLAARQHHAKAGDFGGETAKRNSRAMRAGAHHAAQGLAVDVAHVLEGKAQGMQKRPDPPERRRGCDGRHLALGIASVKAGERRKVDQRSVGCVERCEGMARSRNPHLGFGFAYRRGKFDFIAWARRSCAVCM